MAKQIEYPADTVDAAGNVWPTVGENIRNGAKEISLYEAKALVNALFPVGSVYCGESDFILHVGTWELLGPEGTPVFIGVASTTGTIYNAPIVGTSEASVCTVRLWKRVA